MNANRYCAVSAALFTVVALAHLTRIVNGWPIHVGTMEITMIVSWFGMIVPGFLAAWGFREATRQPT